MTSETIDACRGATSEIAEATAPTWERRRAEIEEVSPEWMLHVLWPREGDTVLELGAGWLIPASTLAQSNAAPATSSTGRRPVLGGEVGPVASGDEIHVGLSLNHRMVQEFAHRGACRAVDVAATRDQAGRGDRDAGR
jgi:hypothetical protein